MTSKIFDFQKFRDQKFSKFSSRKIFSIFSKLDFFYGFLIFWAFFHVDFPCGGEYQPGSFLHSLCHPHKFESVNSQSCLTMTTTHGTSQFLSLDAPLLGCVPIELALHGTTQILEAQGSPRDGILRGLHYTRRGSCAVVFSLRRQKKWG